jgi:ferredoxin
MVSIKVDKTRCTGHARCAAVAPEIYELDDVGYLGFEQRTVPAEQRAQAVRGARACPERAITVDDEDPDRGAT